MKIILLNKQTLHLGLTFFLITGIPTKLQFAVAVLNGTRAFDAMASFINVLEEAAFHVTFFPNIPIF